MWTFFISAGNSNVYDKNNFAYLFHIIILIFILIAKKTKISTFNPC